MLKNKELEEKVLYFESFYRAAPIGIGLVKNRVFQKINSYICKITGYTEEELIGRSSRMLYPSEMEYQMVGEKKYHQISQTGTGAVETRFKCKDGHIIDALLSSTALDINDLSKGVTFTLLDITNLKNSEKQLISNASKLEESKRVYEAFFENTQSANAICRTEDNGQSFIIDKVNSRFEKIENLKSQDVIGKKVQEVFKGADTSDICDIFINVYKTGQHFLGTNKMTKHNSIQTWREHDIFKISSNEVVASYNDRTKEKELEREKLKHYEKTVESLIVLIEHRDNYTGGHSQRVATYSKMVAEELGYSAEDCELIHKAGILHDIGKVTTPDAILLKPGKLREDEYELIKTHVKTGVDMLKKIPMYSDLSDIILSHHEHFNGSGYPQGLSGNHIPPLSRIMAVCDAFDAMTTNRIYQGRKPVDKALAELQSLIGVHYEEKVVKAAQKVLSKIELDNNASQFPETNLEQQRFAFFFKDQVTEAFNESYLRIILDRNKYKSQYIYLGIIFLKNFTQYNEEFGWKNGDLVLNKVSQVLNKNLPEGMVFRLHGDDFVMLNKSDCEVDIDSLEQQSSLPEKNISMTYMHFNIQKDNIISAEEMDNKIHQRLKDLN